MDKVIEYGPLILKAGVAGIAGFYSPTSAKLPIFALVLLALIKD